MRMNQAFLAMPSLVLALAGCGDPLPPTWVCDIKGGLVDASGIPVEGRHLAVVARSTTETPGCRNGYISSGYEWVPKGVADDETPQRFHVTYFHASTTDRFDGDEFRYYFLVDEQCPGDFYTLEPVAFKPEPSFDSPDCHYDFGNIVVKRRYE